MSNSSKLYKSVLYLSQFVVKEEFWEELISKTPDILDRFYVKNDNIRVSIVDKLDNLLGDLRNAKLSPKGERIAVISRKFVYRFLSLLGILVTVTSWKNLVANLLKGKLSALVPLSSLKDLGKLSLSISSFSSLIPLVKLLLDRYRVKGSGLVATGLVTFLSVLSLPNSISNHLAVYLSSYGFESLLKLVELKYGFKLHTPSLFMTLALGGIYHNYVIHPDRIPSYFIKLINFLNSALVETKPAYITRWPDVQEVYVAVKHGSKRGSSVHSELLHSSLKRIETYQPHPLHTNKLLSIMHPSEPSLIKILLRYIPKKFLLITASTLPIFLLVSKLKNEIKLYDDEGKLNLAQLWKQFKPILIRATRLSGLLVLISSTLFTLTVKTQPKPAQLKYIGALSGLWTKLLYPIPSASNMALFTYAFRVAALSVKKSVKGEYVDSALTSIAMVILYYLRENGYKDSITPSRLLAYSHLVF